MSEANKPSWRDFHEPHPTALVFHKLTTAEDRQKMKDDLEKAGRLQARIVTAHVADDSGGKTYVADGITRLDAMEALGWQVVDEHGNWIGAVEGMVDPHRNYTHEQVRQIVISLNATRRHLTKQDIADAIVETLKLERKTEKGVSRNQRRETSPQGGRPCDEFKTEAVKRGEEAGISKRTTEKSLAKQPDRPKITKPPKHKVESESMDQRKQRNAKSLEDRVWAAWSQMLKKFPQPQHPAVFKCVREFMSDKKGDAVHQRRTQPDQAT